MDDEKKDTSEKDNFLVNLNDYQAVRNFSNEDAGKLFHTICQYSLGEEIVDLEDKIQVAFNFFKNRLDKYRKNWEKTRNERIKSGRKGGLAKQANANFVKQNELTVANVAVIDNVNVNDSVNVNDQENIKKLKQKEIIELVIHDLNERLNLKRGFSCKSENNRSKIIARLNEGHTLEDFIIVNEKKVNQWKNDPEMAQYLRPETLYSRKFEGYLNQIEVKDIKVAPKYQTADERRIEHNRKVFEESIKEIENVHRAGRNEAENIGGGLTREEKEGNSGFFSQLSRDIT